MKTKSKSQIPNEYRKLFHREIRRNVRLEIASRTGVKPSSINVYLNQGMPKKYTEVALEVIKKGLQRQSLIQKNEVHV